MATPAIFVNLPVADLPRAEAFYQAIGAEKQPMFSDETAVGMILNGAVGLMLLTHAKFAEFSARRIVDARKDVEVLLALPLASREAVDAICREAGDGGGRTDPGPVQEHGFMYGRSFADPDGHVWEPFWMDMGALPPEMKAQADA